MSATSKRQILNIWKTLLWWALLWAVSFGTACLMYSFTEESGSKSSSFLPITIYRVQPVCFTAGAVIFLAAAVVIWLRLLRPSLLVTLEGSFGWTLLWILISAVGLLAMIAVILCGMILMTDLFAKVSPGILEYWPIAAPVFMLLMIVGNLFYIRSRKR